MQLTQDRAIIKHLEPKITLNRTGDPNTQSFDLFTYYGRVGSLAVTLWTRI
jgi:hypothetical protein